MYVEVVSVLTEVALVFSNGSVIDGTSRCSSGSRFKRVFFGVGKMSLRYLFAKPGEQLHGVVLRRNEGDSVTHRDITLA